ncbi:MAG: hypothetical protein MUF14_11230, partial [Hyphomonadaceae bacterium]|nr:hypothetical protein [Hyphomonadaceae bacterium]
RTGERGSYVVFYTELWASADGEPSGIPVPRPHPANGEDPGAPRRVLRGYTVFNAEQIDGLPEQFAAPPEPVTPVVPLTPEGAEDARLSAQFARRALRGKFFDGCATCAGGANAQRCLPPSAMAETGPSTRSPPM